MMVHCWAQRLAGCEFGGDDGTSLGTTLSCELGTYDGTLLGMILGVCYLVVSWVSRKWDSCDLPSKLGSEENVRVSL